MQKLLNRVTALEATTKEGKKIIFISTIAPLNWRDVVAVTIRPGEAIRFIDQVFKEGTEHIPQKTYDKLSDEEQIQADKHLSDLKSEALRKESTDAESI